jgi:septum formation protein
MLRLLSGRIHEVVTGVCVCRAGSAEAGHYVAGPPGVVSGFRRPRGFSRTRDDVPHVEVARTAVEFAVLEPAVIDWYVASGEPLDKAGAYAIQGLASRFVTRIDGSYSNVVGLPVALVSRMCTAAGILLF